MTTNAAAETGLRLTAGARLELTFSDLLANGQAVGRAGGLVVFCFGPLPGERARVRIESVKRNYAVAEMLELLERSERRADPFCPVFGRCGGCQVQHLSYPAQLEWKRDLVRNALERIGGLGAVDVSPVIGMADGRAYRNKMSLVVDRGPQGVQLGFYAQRSHNVVGVASCPIVLPQLDACLGSLNRAAHEPATTRVYAGARHIVARASRATGQTVVTFSTERRSAALAGDGATLRKALPGVTGIVNSFAPASANAVLGRKAEVAAGAAEIEETIAGIRYRVAAASFFQVNVEIVERIFEHLRPLLHEGQRLVDLYCGAGTFAVFFAQLGCMVLGIEESRRAVAEARGNAARNGLEGRTRFEAGAVEALLARGDIRRGLREADAVFLDPPRKGSDELTLQRLAAAAVPKIWYLSCDPATLARDLRFLAANGYRLDGVTPFDMFPQTGHVETLVTLSRMKGS